MRRGYDRRTGTTHDRRHSRPDWSCGNPACCGGTQDKVRRRAERAGARSELRRTVAEETAQ